jgi:hypothetical protein
MHLLVKTGLGRLAGDVDCFESPSRWTGNLFGCILGGFHFLIFAGSVISSCLTVSLGDVVALGNGHCRLPQAGWVQSVFLRLVLNLVFSEIFRSNVTA